MSNKQLDGWNENETIEFFTSNRKTYDDLYDSEKHFLKESFLSTIETVLDVGCSVGGMYNIFRKLNNKIQYTGLDVSENAIKKAKKSYKDDFANFYHYDGLSAFPMENNEYDLVFSTGVMHLIDNYKDIFIQMLHHSNKYMLLDFRVTPSNSYIGKFYFTFSDKKQASNSTNYYVLNFNELIDFFSEFKEIAQVDIYGYKGKASEMSEGIDEVYMVFFKIKKAPRHNNQIRINFEDTELENIFRSKK